MRLFGLLLFAISAVLLGSAPASADERGFLALFEGQPEATVAPEQEQLAREYPETTRELVPDPTHARPGTITIDTNARLLYLSLPNGMAWRYGVGVGREGFEWRGRTRIGRKESWPSWTPPAAMLRRRPDLPRHMEGGPENPLGARAMYLGSSLYRIHGSNEPWTIGTNVSSGCIRMRNEDVIDLYGRVNVGARVIVL